MTEKGLARMRELEGQIDELDYEINGERPCRK